MTTTRGQTITYECPTCNQLMPEGFLHTDHQPVYTTGAEAVPPSHSNFVIDCSCGKRIYVASLDEAFVIASAERHVADALKAEHDALGEQDCGCVFRVVDWTVTDVIAERCDTHENYIEAGERVSYDGISAYVEWCDATTLGLRSDSDAYVECGRDDEGLVRA